MTFADLQDAVLERFSSDQRANSKLWINLSLAQLWTAEPWTFRLVDSAPTTTAGEVALQNVPDNLGRVKGVWDENGTRLKSFTADEFNDLFLPAASTTGRPWAFCVVGGLVKVGPLPSSDVTYRIVHLSKVTPLVADDDEPLLPEEYHWVLVPGAQSQGQIAFQDPNAGMSLQAWAAALDLLRRDYLEVADMATQWGRAS